MRDPGGSNFAIGWSCILFGLLMGLVMGLWSFDGPMLAPALLAHYDDTPRRLLRLSHVAWIALGLTNVVLALSVKRLPRPAESSASTRPSTALPRALVCMNIGNVFLPLCLLIAVFVPAAKYLMALPASCVVVTAAAMTLIGWRQARADPLADPLVRAETARGTKP